LLDAVFPGPGFSLATRRGSLVNMVAGSHEYLLNTPGASEERERLGAVQAVLDPGTIRHLLALDVGPGHRCLEVGGGAGSIVRWLSDRVGPAGSVTATDLDPHHLVALARERPNVTALRHDIRSDPLPAAAFDFVHVRWVVHHLADRRAVLASLVGALAPGGWFVAEEPDLATLTTDLEAPVEKTMLLRKFVDAMRALYASRGASCEYGRQLFSDVRALGLSDVNGEGWQALGAPGTPLNAMVRLTIAYLRAPLVATGVLDEADVQALVALMNESTFVGLTTVAVWGRRV
jgi:SAM-dependent methyltransferase